MHLGRRAPCRDSRSYGDFRVLTPSTSGVTNNGRRSGGAIPSSGSCRGREGARLTQTPQYLVIVLSDGWSFGGRDLESDAGGYKQRGGSSGLLHKGSWVSRAPLELWMLRCTHKIRPAESSTKWSCGQLSACCEFPRGGHFRVQTGSLGRSVTRVIDEQSKGFGPLDSSFAPVAKKCRLRPIGGAKEPHGTSGM